VFCCSGGGVLWRIKDGKKYAVTGTKGYQWIEREMATVREELAVDFSYFESLKAAAFEAIDFYIAFERFVA
jgi:hypothetical protein